MSMLIDNDVRVPEEIGCYVLYAMVKTPDVGDRQAAINKEMASVIRQREYGDNFLQPSEAPLHIVRERIEKYIDQKIAHHKAGGFDMNSFCFTGVVEEDDVLQAKHEEQENFHEWMITPKEHRSMVQEACVGTQDLQDSVTSAVKRRMHQWHLDSEWIVE